MATSIFFDYTEKDTKILDSIENFNSIDNLIFNLQYYNIPENLDYIDFNEKYEYRPDIVAKIIYDNEFYYPLILVINNISSISMFNISNIGNQIKYLKPNIVNTILNNL